MLYFQKKRNKNSHFCFAIKSPQLWSGNQYETFQINLDYIITQKTISWHLRKRNNIQYFVIICQGWKTKKYVGNKYNIMSPY